MSSGSLFVSSQRQHRVLVNYKLMIKPSDTMDNSGLYEKLLGRDRRQKRRRRIVISSVAALVAVLLCVGGFVVYSWVSLQNGIHRSDILGHQVPPLNGDQNILVMGLDSRLDEDGKPLPAEDYDALHSGDSSDGGYNANVLMLLHVPANGAKATVISIPRDDYVDIPGAPKGQTKAKIKEAYGLALAEATDQLTGKDGMSAEQVYQKARDAGRKAELATVSKFLGGVQIDHFVEVTMGAFLGIAKAVAPITVCLNNATQDSYSGADFKAGVQQLEAQQAVSFVRQRRDTANPKIQLTDLDRARRQQAFIASVGHQLKDQGTFQDIGKLQGILNSVKSKIAVDSGLDLITFAQQAKSLAAGNMAFSTLPIVKFGYTNSGEAINIVDLAQIKSTVKDLLEPASSQQPSTAAGSGSATPTPGNSSPQAPTESGDSGSAPAQDNHYDDWTGALQGGAVACVN